MMVPTSAWGHGGTALWNSTTTVDPRLRDQVLELVRTTSARAPLREFDCEKESKLLRAWNNRVVRVCSFGIAWGTSEFGRFVEKSGPKSPMPLGKLRAVFPDEGNVLVFHVQDDALMGTRKEVFRFKSFAARDTALNLIRALQQVRSDAGLRLVEAMDDNSAPALEAALVNARRFVATASDANFVLPSSRTCHLRDAEEQLGILKSANMSLERELAAALVPGLDGRLDIARLKRAIAAARARNIPTDFAESIVDAAESGLGEASGRRSINGEPTEDLLGFDASPHNAASATARCNSGGPSAMLVDDWTAVAPPTTFSSSASSNSDKYLWTSGGGGRLSEQTIATAPPRSSEADNGAGAAAAAQCQRQQEEDRHTTAVLEAAKSAARMEAGFEAARAEHLRREQEQERFRAAYIAASEKAAAEDAHAAKERAEAAARVQEMHAKAARARAGQNAARQERHLDPKFHDKKSATVKAHAVNLLTPAHSVTSLKPPTQAPALASGCWAALAPGSLGVAPASLDAPALGVAGAPRPPPAGGVSVRLFAATEPPPPQQGAPSVWSRVEALHGAIGELDRRDMAAGGDGQSQRAHYRPAGHRMDPQPQGEF